MTLKNTKASATKQNDGSILCTHEELCSVRKYTIIWDIVHLGGCIIYSLYIYIIYMYQFEISI